MFYAISMQAQCYVAGSGRLSQHSVAFLYADSEAEAYGSGMLQALKLWPKEELWYNHSVTLQVVPKSFILQYLDGVA